MKNDFHTTIKELKSEVTEFIGNRAWEKYHNPKDIAESICIEAAELLERFQWIPPQETLTWKDDPSKVNAVKEEVADIVIYCLSLANVMNIDLTEAVFKKLESNRRRYPADKYHGRAFLKLAER